MSNDRLREKIQALQKIFRSIFDDEELTINSETTSMDVEGWDSLAHIRLIIAIEKYFDLRLTAAEITNLNNVGDIGLLLIQKQSKF